MNYRYIANKNQFVKLELCEPQLSVHELGHHLAEGMNFEDLRVPCLEQPWVVSSNVLPPIAWVLNACSIFI